MSSFKSGDTGAGFVGAAVAGGGDAGAVDAVVGDTGIGDAGMSLTSGMSETFESSGSVSGLAASISLSSGRGVATLVHPGFMSSNGSFSVSDTGTGSFFIGFPLTVVLTPVSTL